MTKEQIKELKAIIKKIGKNNIDAWQSDLEESTQAIAVEDHDETKYNGWMDDLVKLSKTKPVDVDAMQQQIKDLKELKSEMRDVLGYCEEFLKHKMLDVTDGGHNNKESAWARKRVDEVLAKAWQ